MRQPVDRFIDISVEESKGYAIGPCRPTGPRVFCWGVPELAREDAVRSDLELVLGFLDFKRHNKGRSDRTAEIYRLALERLGAFLGESRSLLEATADELVAFAGAWLHKQGIVAESRRPYIAAVRGFYQWCVDKKHLRSNPAAGVPYPRSGKKLPRAMALASAEKLMWAPDFSTFEGVRDGAMFAVLIGCGVRVSGLVNLNESHVTEQLVAGKPRLFIRVVEKGGRERLVPMPAEADLQLRVYLEHPQLKLVDRALPNGDKVLFITTINRRCAPHEYRGERRRFTRGGVLDMVKRYGKKHEIPEAELHPHAMRHLYGTELAEGDVDLLVRQDLMGHEDPKSTRIYTHLAMRKLVKTVDDHGPLSKMKTPTSDILRRLRPA